MDRESYSLPFVLLLHVLMGLTHAHAFSRRDNWLAEFVLLSLEHHLFGLLHLQSDRLTEGHAIARLLNVLLDQLLLFMSMWSC